MRRLGTCLLIVIAATLAGCKKDDPVAPALGPIVLSLEYPNATLGGTAETLRVRAGHDVEGTTEWAAGIDITLLVDGAVAASLAGTTDASGYFSTTISTAAMPLAKSAAVVVPDTVTIDVTADDADSDPVADTVRAPIFEQGLLTNYSTGTNVMEGPVFNGWSADCGGTGNNMYQGTCQAAAACPVNWAWDAFSVEWNGYYYSGTGGTVNFNSHYWVDGIVYVEINGQVVANFDTTGGGYSGNVTLPAHTWVPVNMTFAGNGGSNNMHLGRAATGALGWEAVPRVALGTPRAWLLAGKAN